MIRIHQFFSAICLSFSLLFISANAQCQQLPPRYATLELFTNTPCPICASQNPGLFSRLEAYEGQFHLISFYPGKPYASCIFYQANIPENTARYQFYTGHVFGTPTVVINGTQFKSSNGVTNNVLDAVTGDESWLNVRVEETSGTQRNVDITLTDVAGNSVATGKLFAVIVEREINYNAPNGETIHHNVFRKFLTEVAGEDVDMTSGEATKSYSYNVEAGWQAKQTYVIAWLMDPATNEIYNSGTKYDPLFTTGVEDIKGDNELLIFPNPATTEFHIPLADKMHDSHILIYDAAGKLVFENNIVDQTEAVIDCRSYPEGLYLVKIFAEQREWSGRVQVMK